MFSAGLFFEGTLQLHKRQKPVHWHVVPAGTYGLVWSGLVWSGLVWNVYNVNKKLYGNARWQHVLVAGLQGRA